MSNAQRVDAAFAIAGVVLAVAFGVLFLIDRKEARA